MYQLTLHIEYLLLRHDCVIVPGLGAFINVYESAYYDESTRTWHPMRREVRFNGSLKHDDGILANSYARKNCVGFATGRELMHSSVAHLLESLTNDGEVTIGNLGTLRKEEGALIFRPMLDSRRLAETLGYRTIAERPAVAEEKKAETEERHVAVAAVPKEESRTATAVADERGSRKFDTRRNYYIPVNKIFARSAAIFFVVVAVALSIVLPFAGHQDKIDKASVVPVERIIPHAMSTEADEAEPETAEPEPNKVGGKYHAVVATFKTSGEAEEFISQKGEAGKGLRIISTSTKSRVTAGSSDSKEELSSRISAPEFRESFSEAWIWEYEE